jgi:hypothetical protein
VLLLAFRSGWRARCGGLVVVGEELVGHGEVPAIPDLVVQAADASLARIWSHGRPSLTLDSGGSIGLTLILSGPPRSAAQSSRTCPLRELAIGDRKGISGVGRGDTDRWHYACIEARQNGPRRGQHLDANEGEP